MELILFVALVPDFKYILSCLVLPCLVLSCTVWSGLVWSDLILSYLIFAANQRASHRNRVLTDPRNWMCQLPIQELFHVLCSQCVSYIFVQFKIAHFTLYNPLHVFITSWALYQIRKIAGCVCAGNAGNVFPATDFKGNRQFAIPACITARASRTCRDACRNR